MARDLRQYASVITQMMITIFVHYVVSDMLV
jgi:hypothetical protein